MLPKNKKLPNKKPNTPTKLGGRPKHNNPPKHNPKGHGGKGKPKGKGKGGAPKGAFFGGHGGFKGVRKGMVSRLTDGLMREEMNGLNRQAREV